MRTYELLKYFNGVKGRNGSYMALCPAHKDKQQSLSITAKEDVTLIHCFAGCNAKDILEKVGLKFSDLYENDNLRKQVNNNKTINNRKED